MATKSAYENKGGNKDIVFGNFQFLQISTGGAAFSAIFRQENNHAGDTQNCENVNREYFFSIWISFLCFWNSRLNGLHFRRLEIFVFEEDCLRNLWYKIIPFPKFLDFWLNSNRPLRLHAVVFIFFTHLFILFSQRKGKCMNITFCPSNPLEPFIPNPPVSPWKLIMTFVSSVFSVFFFTYVYNFLCYVLSYYIM